MIHSKNDEQLQFNEIIGDQFLIIIVFTNLLESCDWLRYGSEALLLKNEIVYRIETCNPDAFIQRRHGLSSCHSKFQIKRWYSF